MKYLILSFVVAILVGIFAVQNSMIVPISFLGWSFETSLVIVILLSATFGAIVVTPPVLFMQYRLRRQISKLETAHQLLESEHQALKEQMETETAVNDSENPPAETKNGG